MRSTPLLLSGLAILAVVFSIMAIARARTDRRHVAHLRALADRALSETKISSSNPRFRFDGSTCHVERREETGGVRGLFQSTADFGVTIHATNPDGERFLFKWFSKSDKPFVKHLPPCSDTAAS